MLGLKLKFTFIISFLIFLLACSHNVQGVSGQRSSEKIERISKSQAIDSAMQIAKERNPQIEEFISKARFEEDKWYVFIEFVMGYDKNGEPLVMVGGDCIVTVDESGKFLDYFIGE